MFLKALFVVVLLLLVAFGVVAVIQFQRLGTAAVAFGLALSSLIPILKGERW